MLRVYASKSVEAELLSFLAEFKARVYTNYPVKGVTRKVSGVRGRGKKLYKVVNFPIN